MSDTPPTSSAALVLRGLRKTVPGGRLLFDGLDLTLAAGEVVAIMGESGVGKSTLLNVIAGLDSADQGQISVGGARIDRLDENARTILRRDRIGFVFQAFHILPHLSLAQNIALPLVLGRSPRRAALRKAEAMLAEIGLAGRGDDYAAQLSGGELQRIAIARALVHDPALILADEPTGNLDPDTAEKILTLLLRVTRAAGAAAIIVTHSERAAGRADRCVMLGKSGLVPHGR